MCDCWDIVFCIGHILFIVRFYFFGKKIFVKSGIICWIIWCAFFTMHESLNMAVRHQFDLFVQSSDKHGKTLCFNDDVLNASWPRKMSVGVSRSFAAERYNITVRRCMQILLFPQPKLVRGYMNSYIPKTRFKFLRLFVKNSIRGYS